MWIEVERNNKILKHILFSQQNGNSLLVSNRLEIIVFNWCGMIFIAVLHIKYLEVKVPKSGSEPLVRSHDRRVTGDESVQRCGLERGIQRGENIKNSFHSITEKFFRFFPSVLRRRRRRSSFAFHTKKDQRGREGLFNIAKKDIRVTILRYSILSLACYSRTSWGLCYFRFPFEKFFSFSSSVSSPHLSEWDFSLRIPRLVCVVSSSATDGAGGNRFYERRRRKFSLAWWTRFIGACMIS